MVCLRNISVDTLYKGDTEDDDNNNNNNNNNNNTSIFKPVMKYVFYKHVTEYHSKFDVSEYRWRKNQISFIFCFPQTLTLRRLMSYIHGAPILDVSRSHTTTQHSR